MDSLRRGRWAWVLICCLGALQAGFATPATIASVFPAQGGSTGESFLLTCPTGSYVTGFTGASGNLVEGVSLMCSDGSTLTPAGTKKSGKPFAYGSDSGFIGVSAITSDTAVEAVSFQGYDKKFKKYMHSPVYGRPGGKEHKMTCKGPERVIGIHGKHGQQNPSGMPRGGYGSDCGDYLSSFGVICGKPPCGRKGKDCEFPSPCSLKTSRKFKGGCFAQPCSGCSFGYPCEIGCPDHPCAGCPYSNPCDTSCPNKGYGTDEQTGLLKNMTKLPYTGISTNQPVALVTSNCPPGYYVAEGKCVRCSPGTYSLGGGTANCNACKPGTYAEEGASECSLCSAGSFSDSKAARCTPCALGTFSNKPGSPQCTQCRAGMYATANATSCEPCAPGYMSAAGSKACTACEAGTVSEHTADKCTTCPAGTYSEQASQECTACSAGEYAEQGSGECKACTPGTYSGEKAASCDPCAAGTYSEIKAKDCTACPAGTYSQKGAGKCLICEPGTWSAGQATICTACTAGTYSASSGTQCQQCPASTYSGDKAATCSTCPSHLYTLYPGSTKCETCEALMKVLLQRVAKLETDTFASAQALDAAQALGASPAEMPSPITNMSPVTKPINNGSEDTAPDNTTLARVSSQQLPAVDATGPPDSVAQAAANGSTNFNFSSPAHDAAKSNSFAPVAMAPTSVAAAVEALAAAQQHSHPVQSLVPGLAVYNRAAAPVQRPGAPSRSQPLTPMLRPAHFSNYLAQAAIPAAKVTPATTAPDSHDLGKPVAATPVATVAAADPATHSMQAVSAALSSSPLPADAAQQGSSSAVVADAEGDEHQANSATGIPSTKKALSSSKPAGSGDKSQQQPATHADKKEAAQILKGELVNAVPGLH